LIYAKPLGPKATDVSATLRSFETSANYSTVDMKCHIRIPDNSMIRAIKAEGDMRARGRRNKFTQDFSRKKWNAWKI